MAADSAPPPPHFPQRRYIGSDADQPPPPQPHPHPNSVHPNSVHPNSVHRGETNHCIPEYHHQMVVPSHNMRNGTMGRNERDIVQSIYRWVNTELQKELQTEIQKMWQHINQSDKKFQEDITKKFQDVEQWVAQMVEQRSYAINNDRINDEERIGVGGADNNPGIENSGDGGPYSFNSSKKQRVVWSPELHKDFINAVKSIGNDRAVPKKILDVMKSKGHINLRRENIASHLQKYRESMGKPRRAHPSNTPGVVSPGDQVFSTPTLQNNLQSANAIGMPLPFQNNPSSTNLIGGGGGIVAGMSNHGLQTNSQHGQVTALRYSDEDGPQM